MFPGAGAEITYNEAGEPLGWDYPGDDLPAYYCDRCGREHTDGCDD